MDGVVDNGVPFKGDMLEGLGLEFQGQATVGPKISSPNFKILSEIVANHAPIIVQ